MTRLSLFVFAMTAVGCADPLRADWWTWHSWKSHYHQNQRWPEQFLDHDRSAVRAPMQVMIANGWRTTNTLANYHFNEVTGELNDAGKLRLRSVLFETPEAWRTVYVLRADVAEVTANRLKSVRQIAGEMLQGEAIPPVLVTTIEPRGTRGDVANGVNQRFMENAPIPVLPQRQGEETN